MTAGPLIRAEGAALRYRPDAPAAVCGLDLEVRAGDAVGIVGESGSGKSSVARLLTGVRQPSVGRVEISGRSWAELTRRDPARRSVQMIFQDPYAALNPWLTARETVAEVIRHWDRVGRGAAARAAEDLLGEAGLSRDAMSRKPGQLSGGQCQRVGIARALACSPDLIVADEPTSALDVSVQAQILNLLVGLRASRGLAVVLISHDLAVVQYLTDRCLVMKSGAVIEEGTTDQIMQLPSHEYTQALISAVPGRDLGSGLRA